MSLFGGSSNCPICDRSLVPEQGEGWRLVGGARPADWFLTHCQSDHQDYLGWKRSKSLLIVFLGITTTIILGLLLSYVLYISGVRLPGRTGGGSSSSWRFPLSSSGGPWWRDSEFAGSDASGKREEACPHLLSQHRNRVVGTDMIY